MRSLSTVAGSSRWGAVVGLACAILLAACSKEPAAPLRLGTNVWPGYEPLYLARALGYFPEGTVELVEYLSASEVLRAFRGKAIEAAALTLDEVLLLQQHGVPVHVVLVTDISHGADVILGKPSINRFSDVVGKRIGVEGGALGAYVLSRALDLHDVRLDALEIVQLEVSEHELAYQRDEIDAVVTFEPVRSKLLAQGAVELFTSREIPGEIVDVVVIHRDMLEQRLATVIAVIDSWFRALDYFRQSPNEAAAHMSERLRLPPESVLLSYDNLHLPSREENRRMLGGPTPALAGTLQRLQDVMVAKGLLEAPVTVDGLLRVVETEKE